jgi:hypothetical protein
MEDIDLEQLPEDVQEMVRNKQGVFGYTKVN